MNGQVDPILEEPAKYIISKNILYGLSQISIAFKET